jgi:hypothetical protein
LEDGTVDGLTVGFLEVVGDKVKGLFDGEQVGKRNGL